MNENQRITEASVVADLAARNVLLGSAPKPVQRTRDEGAPFVVLVDASGTQRALPLAEYEPPRKKAHAEFVEASGFCDYVKLYGDAASRIFCDVDRRLFEAVLDYHEPESADDLGRRGEHRATLALKLTEPFEAWQKLAGQPVAQAAFAEFLEDHYGDIEEPDGAAILELARTLEVKNDVAFKSVQRKSDGGYDLRYEETVTARAGQQGNIEVPSRFLLAVQVFQGGAVVRLPVRLRFRQLGGAVAFLLTFIGLEKILRAEVDRVRLVVEEATGRSVWAGAVKVG